MLIYAVDTNAQAPAHSKQSIKLSSLIQSVTLGFNDPHFTGTS